MLKVHEGTSVSETTIIKVGLAETRFHDGKQNQAFLPIFGFEPEIDLKAILGISTFPALYISRDIWFGVVSIAGVSDGVIADPATDTSTIASPTIHVAAATHWHSSSAHDIGSHAI
ncbi:hypothetical protein F0562_006667 [Nyssa sinensis]|uniref:Uncharacterized protein n=1 Tax=Nyssa sinensis TaxID=561372 RepID=A0A5J5AT45_9ASTE|nr:hypothetical protein F0562_006667 [Nyssa sinensis]